MKKFSVGIREVHVSIREVIVGNSATKEDILKAAENVEEISFEYSHTLDHENTSIEEIPLIEADINEISDGYHRMMEGTEITEPND